MSSILRALAAWLATGENRIDELVILNSHGSRSGQPGIPLLCAAACNLLVARPREVVKEPLFLSAP